MRRVSGSGAGRWDPQLSNIAINNHRMASHLAAAGTRSRAGAAIAVDRVGSAIHLRNAPLPTLPLRRLLVLLCCLHDLRRLLALLLHWPCFRLAILLLRRRRRRRRRRRWLLLLRGLLLLLLKHVHRLQIHSLLLLLHRLCSVFHMHMRLLLLLLAPLLRCLAIHPARRCLHHVFNIAHHCRRCPSICHPTCRLW